MFFRKTVDGIIQDITNKIEQLHIVAEFHQKEAQIHNAIISERAQLAAVAEAEASRAKAIAAKFLALVSA